MKIQNEGRLPVSGPTVQVRPTVTVANTNDAVVDRLRRLIWTLELEPGAIVTESYLSELLGCSRTPAREALQRLAGEQLVEITPRRFVKIAEMNRSDVPVIFEAMLYAVRIAAELSASRISNRQLDVLSQILDEAEQAEQRSDLVGVLELDFMFHNTMTEATDNPYLAKAFAPIHRLAGRFGYAAYSVSGTSRASLAEHRGILEALVSRDRDLTVELASAHVAASRDRIQAEL